jgi:ribosomal protein S18 acetylase RimI-like enzyme
MTTGTCLDAPAFRPATPHDAPFQLALYADTRAPEFACLPADHSALLVRLQHEARSAGYAAAYPEAVDEIIEVDGRPAGRILVAESGGTRHVVDVAVLRGDRGQGLASAAITRWAAITHAEGRSLTLLVFDDNPAVDLYHRLGFEITGAAGAGRVRMTLPAPLPEKEAGR